MPRYILKIAYDGTHYSGWQVQPSGTTVQELLQTHATTFLGAKTHITGSGRTDAGVHAREQVAHFDTDEPIDTLRFLRSMNGMLPVDIRIDSCEEAPADFHARYSAKGKTYHYHIALTPAQSPFERLYSLHLMREIDLDLLRAAAQKFVGEHDFTSFANSASEGCAARGAVRTIHRIDVIEQEGGIRLEFEGKGFLYKMIRNIVGTMLCVATGKRPLHEIDQIFAARDRRIADRAAPAKGLVLVRVLYESENDG